MLGAILAAATPAIISGFGQSQTNAASARDAERNRQFNADEAQKARNFTAEQSATEVQRRVADIKAAGLNPALAYGNPAASNPGASAANSSSMPSRGNAAGAGMASAFQALEFARQVEALKNQTKLTDAQVLQANTQTIDTLATQQPRIRGMAAGSAWQEEQTEQLKALFALNAEILKNQALVTRNSAWELETRAREQTQRTKREDEAFYSGFGRYAPYINSAKGIIQDLWKKHVGKLNPFLKP